MSHGTIRYTWKAHACFICFDSYANCTHSTLTLFVLTPLLHYLYSRHSYTICAHSTLTLFVLTPLLHYLHSLHSYIICTHSTLTLFVLTPLLHYLYSLHSYTICTHSIQIFYTSENIINLETYLKLIVRVLIYQILIYI